MYRLGQLNDRQRVRLGAGLLAAGTVGMILGVWFTHYSGLPESEFVDGQFVPVVLGEFNWVPRGCMIGEQLPCLPWRSLGYVVVFAASQLMVVGACILWVLNQPMTWARATFAAFVAWIELVIIFGIVPSEWLNLSQTDLEWSPQRVAFALPRWLVLGNDIEISWAVIKDAISGAYNTGLLVAAGIFAYKLQDIGKKRPPAAEEEQVSPYGRPLVRGEG